MSTIADELTRIQNAKASLATSIAAKGVEVPASTKIDGYSSLVDQIAQGGGQTHANGTFTIASRAFKTPLIQHNLNANHVLVILKVVSDAENYADFGTEAYSPIMGLYTNVFEGAEAYFIGKNGEYAYKASEQEVGQVIALNSIGTPPNVNYTVYKDTGLQTPYNVFESKTANELVVNVGRYIPQGMTYNYDVYKLD